MERKMHAATIFSAREKKKERKKKNLYLSEAGR